MSLAYHLRWGLSGGGLCSGSGVCAWAWWPSGAPSCVCRLYCHLWRRDCLVGAGGTSLYLQQESLEVRRGAEKTGRDKDPPRTREGFVVRRRKQLGEDCKEFSSGRHRPVISQREPRSWFETQRGGGVEALKGESSRVKNNRCDVHGRRGSESPEQHLSVNHQPEDDSRRNQSRARPIIRHW